MLLPKSKRAKLKPHFPIHSLIYSLSIVNHLLGAQQTKALKALLFPITCVGDAFTDSLISRSGSHVHTLYLIPTPPSQAHSSFSFSHLSKWQHHFSSCSSPKPLETVLTRPFVSHPGRMNSICSSFKIYPKSDHFTFPPLLPLRTKHHYISPGLLKQQLPVLPSFCLAPHILHSHRGKNICFKWKFSALVCLDSNEKVPQTERLK